MDLRLPKRLCRSDLRKGCAFPEFALAYSYYVEAVPQPARPSLAEENNRYQRPGKAHPFRKAGRRSRTC